MQKCSEYDLLKSTISLRFLKKKSILLSWKNNKKTISNNSFQKSHELFVADFLATDALILAIGNSVPALFFLLIRYLKKCVNNFQKFIYNTFLDTLLDEIVFSKKNLHVKVSLEICLHLFIPKFIICLAVFNFCLPNNLYHLFNI